MATGKKKQKKAAATSSLSAKDQKLLTALDRGYEAPPNGGIAVSVQDTRELEAATRKLGPALVAGSALDAATLRSLPKRRAMLAAAEKDWSKHRSKLTPPALRATRVEAEALREDVLAAVRYFCKGDAAAQKEVDDIREGAGLADLIEDLGRVADLVDAHGKHLKKAKLPPKSAARARALAEALGGGTADRATDRAGAAALSLRNRAFWYLHDATDAVRAAGRYVYRKDPKTLSLFREHVRHTPKKKSPAKPTAPAA